MGQSRVIYLHCKHQNKTTLQTKYKIPQTYRSKCPKVMRNYYSEPKIGVTEEAPKRKQGNEFEKYLCLLRACRTRRRHEK